MMLFCAYCGKSFTRKEHLERHIPSHTNVKPHRCGSCQLSFSRRDLLQRHHSTYHEVRDPTQPLASSVPTLAGRTPIACMNCASAKTGCDKQVPCSRCAEKNLPCAARFARRASKILRRMATSQDQTSPPKQLISTLTAPLPPPQLSPPIPSGHDMHGHNHTRKRSPAYHSEYFQDHKPSAASETGMASSFIDPNTFMNYPTDFIDPDLQYPDYLQWSDFTMDPSMYSSEMISPDFGRANYSDQELSSGSEGASSYPCLTPLHSRQTSVRSLAELRSPPQLAKSTSTPLQQAMLAGEIAWPLAKCHPPGFSSTCPRTALLHLENLEHSSRHEECWMAIDSKVDRPTLVVPLHDRTRDRILAITQGVLQKALIVHRGSSKDRRTPPTPVFELPLEMNYLALPPTKTLELFLHNYMHELSLQHASIPGGILDVNDLALRNQGSTLLALLMLAQGASNAGTEEARGFSAGLTEMCRISLFDMIEKDVELVADQAILQCALIFTNLGAWSGDKWHMDISTGQRGMYLAMLKHSGALESQPASFPGMMANTAPELQWRSWLHLEGMNRLVYDWVMLDFELSLFYDSGPVLQISELEARLPNSDSLWLAKGVEEWAMAVQELYPSKSSSLNMPQLPLSLFELFQEFLQGNFRESQVLTMTQLRLLLHPLQTMIHQARQTLSCFSEVLSPNRQNTRTMTRESTMTRLEEIQALLLRWYELYLHSQHNRPGSPFLQTTLILYHLLSLSIVTSFSEVEKLARKDNFDGSYWELSLRHKRCIQNSTEAIFHCGQVLRILKTVAHADRPAWWPIAVYRVTLILWIDCIAKADPNFPQQQPPGPLIPVDELNPEDHTLNAWRWNGEGLQVLVRSDGGVTKMNIPEEVLGHCVGLLEDNNLARMTDGIRRKLMKLHSSWHLPDSE